MALTDQRKAEISAIVDETVKAIRNANTVEELGLALERFNSSRQADEGDEQDAEWVLRLLGRKLGEVDEQEFSPARSAVYSMLAGGLVGSMLMVRLVPFQEKIDELMSDPFGEFSS